MTAQAPAHTNRLENEPSPYLRQHAHNPVDWHPWGNEALELARNSDRPILLSIGYSACHWCHVMAHESFENEATSQLMNAHFVCVKIDREEHPDIDQLYQGVVQLMGRSGGWPLTVFLTPSLQPFFGGTYFPPAPRHGLPSFDSLLRNINELWHSQRPDITQQAETFQDGLISYADHGLGTVDATVSVDRFVTAARSMLRHVDRQNGGFGSQPKFPNPMNVAVLLRAFRRTNEVEFRDLALLSLEKMARGGVFDQLGGGFHRYSVDASWRVPHFEKMLYDNAQLIHLYAEAEQLSPNPLWVKTVTETISYLEREMKSPEGAFYAAQDADSEGEEGKFFVWTPDEMRDVLGTNDADLICAHLGVTDRGNFEHGQSVLEIVQTSEALALAFQLPKLEVDVRLNAAKKKLLEARSKRIAPGTDDKILCGWNGLTIRGLAFASRAFQAPAWAHLATQCADVILTHMLTSDGRLYRCFQNGQARLPGLLEDYGHLAAGLVALAQATFEERFLTAATSLVDKAFELFFDAERVAFRTTAVNEKTLPVTTWSTHDNASPSGASTLIEATLALGALLSRSDYIDRARAYLSRHADEAVAHPLAFGHLLTALDTSLDGALCITVTDNATQASPYIAVVNGNYNPTACVKRASAIDNLKSAILCQNFACTQPFDSAHDFVEALNKASERC